MGKLTTIFCLKTVKFLTLGCFNHLVTTLVVMTSSKELLFVQEQSILWSIARGFPSWKFRGCLFCTPQFSFLPRGWRRGALSPRSPRAWCCQSLDSGSEFSTHTHDWRGVDAKWRTASRPPRPFRWSSASRGLVKAGHWWKHLLVGSPGLDLKWAQFWKLSITRFFWPFLGKVWLKFNLQGWKSADFVSKCG